MLKFNLYFRKKKIHKTQKTLIYIDFKKNILVKVLLKFFKIFNNVVKIKKIIQYNLKKYLICKIKELHNFFK